MNQIQIQSGGGAYLAAVNSANQLLTRAVAVSPIHEASLIGNAFSWTSVSADIDTGDTALLVANTAASKWLVIAYAYIWVNVAAQVKLHVPAVATYTGTAVVGVNLNRNYANNAPAVAYTDETAKALGNGAGNVIQTLWIAESTNVQTTCVKGETVDFKGSLILGTNDAIALDIITEPTGHEVTFVGYFIDSPN